MAAVWHVEPQRVDGKNRPRNRTGTGGNVLLQDFNFANSDFPELLTSGRLDETCNNRD